MTKRLALLLFLSLIGPALFSCAKQPLTKAEAPAAPPVVTTPAAAPKPAPAPRAAVPTPLATPSPAITPAPPATVRQPAPREFTAVAALKDIHFDFDSYDIRPGDVKILGENARWMKANENYLILIEGHCDERGTNEYNLALGERRAKSTMNYLVTLGVQARRINTISYGEERPLCTEKNEGCWAQKRRAHFQVKAQ